MDASAASPSQRRSNRTIILGAAVLGVMAVICVGTLPFTVNQFNDQDLNRTLEAPRPSVSGQGTLLGTDTLGRSLAVRCALGGAISLGIGLAAAAIAVTIGTAWGMIAGYAGGRVDAVMMRFVDVLYGLPYILIVLLLVVAVDGLIMRFEAASQDETPTGVLKFVLENRWLINISALFIAIGAVSWLTLARVVRGQVLSIKGQPYVEAARAAGCSVPRILFRHVLPNLVGPIIVYTTLTVPQAILQESFLSFLGIGVQEPLPSWGVLAAEGLGQLNLVKSHWWLLAWPCAALGLTLLALNFLGDGLRERLDPHAARS
ncbi:MAG: peptide ABC transporter permease [Planctomycetaceae bacterium]|nr:peptide ABC transporter permease [Planctomycetaceae bacterium]